MPPWRNEKLLGGFDQFTADLSKDPAAGARWIATEDRANRHGGGQSRGLRPQLGWVCRGLAQAYLEVWSFKGGIKFYGSLKEHHVITTIDATKECRRECVSKAPLLSAS